MESSDLEKSVGRAFRRLPAPRAPHTLLPRVMAAVALLAARPWYTRTWFTWPVPIRIGAAVAVMVLVALTFQFSYAAEAMSAALSQPLHIAAGWAPSLLRFANAISTIVGVAWRNVLEPALILGFIVVVLTLLTGGACWTLVNRLTPASEKV